jgi:hypothetical protein
MGLRHSFKPQGALRLFSNIVVAGSLLSGAVAQDDSTRLRDCLSNASILPSLTTFSDATNWETVTSPWALRFNPEPAAVVVPRNRDEVAAALACAVEAGVKVSPLNGGHSYGAYGLGGVDGALVINMERFTETTFDSAKNLFTYVSSKPRIRSIMLTIAVTAEEAELDLPQHGSGKTMGVTSLTSEPTGSVSPVRRLGVALVPPVVSSAPRWTTSIVLT